MRDWRIGSKKQIIEKTVPALEIERIPISAWIVLCIVLGCYVSWSFQEQNAA